MRYDKRWFLNKAIRAQHTAARLSAIARGERPVPKAMLKRMERSAIHRHNPRAAARALYAQAAAAWYGMARDAYRRSLRF